MAKQVSLTRRHKTALVDLYLGSTDLDALDLQIKVELISSGFLDHGVLTKSGIDKAQELMTKVKSGTQTK